MAIFVVHGEVKFHGTMTNNGRQDLVRTAVESCLQMTIPGIGRAVGIVEC